MASVSFPAVAQAQANTSPSASLPATGPGPEEKPTELQPVVVTAQRRREVLVNVPITVTVLSAAKLKKSGVSDLSELSQVVPAFQSGWGGAYFQPVIRGVSTQIASAGADSNIATYVDGIYRPNGDAFIDFLDVDSIQILEGPQGTLFGRNATGGAIVVTTKDPSFQPAAEVHLGYGSFNQAKGSAFLSSGITDTIATSLAVGFGRSDGWIKNTATGGEANPSNDYTLRSKILYEPSSKLKVMLTGELSRISDPTLYASSPYNGESNAALFGVPLSINNSREISQGGDAANVMSSRALALTVTADLGFATLTSISSSRWDQGYQRDEAIASLYPVNGTLPLPGTSIADTILNANWTIHENTYSQEFDLSHSSGPIDWTTGLFYFYDSTAFLPLSTDIYGPFGPGGAYVQSGNQPIANYAGINQSYAAFADATYNIGKWHLTAGARYSLDLPSIWYQGISSLATGFSSTPRLTASKSLSSVTPRLVIRYSVTPDSNVYASWSVGEKAGFYNTSGFLVQSTPVKPETLYAYEIGYKISRPRWELGTSAYYYDYKDLQIATYEGAYSIQQNAPRSQIYGAEAQGSFRLSDNLSFDLGGAYTHARYTDFPDAALTLFSPVYGIEQGSAHLANVAGKQMVRSPDFTGSFGPSYVHPLYQGALALNANYAYQTRSFFDAANTLPLPAYGLLNLRAAWTDPSGRWTVSVSGKNVLNQKYKISLNPGGGAVEAVYGEPSSAFVDIGYKY